MRTAPLILAHRGDWTDAPENSLAAFGAAALRPGVDGVEFDVRAARDGAPVVIHDRDLARVQGVDRRVDELSPTELGELGVPGLAAVVEVRAAPFFLDVELKDAVAAEVVPILARARGDPPTSTVVSSFRDEILEALAAIAPGWPTWLIDHRLDRAVVERAHSVGCRGIAAEWPALDRSAVDLALSVGLELATWTVADPQTLGAIADLGLVAICVDPPALLP